MFKLIIVGGKRRGEEFILSQGENIIGRDPSASISLDIDGISKQHVKLTVEKNSIYLEDLGSSNGTFVNGKLTQKMTLLGKEKIALPNVIFQLVLVKEKKKIVKKKVLKADDDQGEEDGDVAPPAPSQPLAKILHYFKYKAMPVVYTFNKEYEWHSLTMAFLLIYIFITIGLTIIPVLEDNRKVLIEEIIRRGGFITKTVADANRVYLLKNNFEAIDTEFLNHEPGIVEYELYNPEGIILRPLEKLNTTTQDVFSIEAMQKFSNDSGGIHHYKFLGDGKVGIARLIKTYDMRSASEKPVGVVMVKFAPRSLISEAANNKKAYLESFTSSALVGILFFAILYFLTLKYFDDLRIQIDKVMRGKQKEISAIYRFKEMKPLVSTLNGLLQRYMDYQNRENGEEAGIGEVEEDSKYVEILKEFMLGAHGAAMVMNSEKIIQSINLQAEDLTGIRESVGVGVSIIDVARDQGFAATVLELCEESASNGGVSQKGNYELTGVPHEIFVTSLIGKDNFAKAFYITFVRED